MAFTDDFFGDILRCYKSSVNDASRGEKVSLCLPFARRELLYTCTVYEYSTYGIEHRHELVPITSTMVPVTKRKHSRTTVVVQYVHMRRTAKATIDAYYVL